MSKTRALFIINPKSGARKKRIAVADSILELLSPNIEAEILVWEYPLQAQDIVLRIRESDCELAVAAGGDGTVNLVGSAVIGTDKTFGIIPLGSGNGLARHLGIPLSPGKAIESINKGRVKKIDAGICNEQPFFCTSGTGFDAYIGERFSKSEERGFINYLKLIYSEFKKYKPQVYTLEIDGKVLDREAFFITIANAGQFGNNAWIAPKADISDGLLDVSILKKPGLAAAARIGLRLFRKTLDKSAYYEHFRGKEIRIERTGKGPVHIDGEPLNLEADIHYTVKHLAISVLLP